MMMYYMTSSRQVPGIDDDDIVIWMTVFMKYHQISNMNCTEPQNLNVSHLALQMSLCNLLKPGVKSKMKM